jgi:hypothetical protein
MDLMNLLGSLVMSLSRLVARTVSFKTLFMLFINVSEDPPEVINYSNFLLISETVLLLMSL